MAEENTTQGTSAPAPTEQQPATPAPAAPAPAEATPVAQPAPAPATPEPKANDDKVVMPREAFNARVASAEQAAQRKVYESLGKSEAEIKALLEADAARADAQKTLEQRVADRDAALAAEKAKASSYLQTINQRAKLEMQLLDDAQKQAVSDVISRLGADPEDGAAQLGAIDALRPTWNAKSAGQTAQEAQPQASQATPPVEQTQQTPAKPAPTATAPAPSAPGDSTPTSPPDHAAFYRDLKERNPFAAAEYARAHPEVWGGMVR